MALQRHGGRVGAIGAIGHIARNPQIQRALFNAARQGGAYLGGRLREFANNRQAVDREDGDEDDYDMGNQDNTVSSSSDNGGAVGGNMVYGGEAGGGGIGYRGTLTGNTQLHKGYAEHYHEIHELHSRKVRNHMLLWGLSAYGWPVANQLYKSPVGGIIVMSTGTSPASPYIPFGTGSDKIM